VEIVPRVTGSLSSKPRSVKLVTALVRFPYVALPLNYFPNGKTSVLLPLSLAIERENKLLESKKAGHVDRPAHTRKRRVDIMRESTI